MKNLLVALVSIVALVILTFVAFSYLAHDAEKKSERALASIELPRAVPSISEKNAAAVKAEEVAQTIGIDLQPRGERETPPPFKPRSGSPTLNPWLTRQHENPSDEIEPLPDDLRKWIDENRAAIDLAARTIAEGDATRWISRPDAIPIRQPLPNLLGHMELFRTLTLATLERELAGDHAAAWTMQHATWKVAQGLLDRPELISRLIGIAGVRLMIATQRKLEPPVPAWTAELYRQRLFHAVHDSVFLEIGHTAEMLKEGSWVEEVRAEAAEGGGPGIVASLAMRPVVRWAAAEKTSAAVTELARIRDIEPCAYDSREVGRRIRENTSPFAKRFGVMELPEIASALSRGAMTDVAIEGTAKVLALKAARAANGEWPETISEESALCSGARWEYRAAGSGMSLRFTGKLDQPAGFQGTKIPTEYRDRGAASGSSAPAPAPPDAH